MNEICGDNRFDIIESAKKMLLDATNIESSQDEMKVLDNILFRFWQMGWLPGQERTCEIEAHNDYGPHMEDCIWHLSCGHHSFGYKPNYCETCGAKVVS